MVLDKVTNAMVAVIFIVLMSIMLLILGGESFIVLDDNFPDLSSVNITGAGIFDSLGPLVFGFGLVIAVVLVIVLSVVASFTGILDDLDF